MPGVWFFATAIGLVSIAPVIGQAAQSRTATLRASATIVADCIIVVRQDVQFGAYDPVGANAAAPLDAVGLVDLTCTRGTIASVNFDQGQNSQANSRRMTNGSGFLGYLLFEDAARTRPVGPGQVRTLPAAPSTRTRTVGVFGRIAPGQDVPLGNYVDTVTVTVRF